MIKRAVWLLVVVACTVPNAVEREDVQEALSPNPCTAVTLTAPAQGFVITPGVAIPLTGAASCPAGQTPEYQYWVRKFDAANWTILTGYLPGSASWTPPTDEHWCVSVVTRAIGAPERYQARSSARCSTPRCGNHVIDPGEQCDDGNFVNGDACDVNCTVPACGNGILDAGEQCEDGNTIDGDGCEADCTVPRCGNGVRDPGEACDDGNLTEGDGCDSNCTVPACGNGVVDPGEQCDDGNPTNGDACDVNCTVPACGNAVVDPGEQCDDGNATTGDGCAPTCTLDGLSYVKASNTAGLDRFGHSVALSADGLTLAVGAAFEASASTGVGGNEANDAAPEAGAVYVFRFAGGAWIQEAYVKASNTDAHDGFGWAVALSADGSTLAVGAPFEDGLFGGIDQHPEDNSCGNAGAAYVFTRTAGAWHQQAYVKPASNNPNSEFGISVALAGDGSTLVVGAPIDGAAYAFTRTGTAWSAQAQLVGPFGDRFSWTLALSADGTTLAIGAIDDDSSATGVGGDPVNNNRSNSGAVYVLTRSGSTWTQQAYIKASNTGFDDAFGSSVALSANGSTLAVGAPFESSAGTNPFDDSAPRAGAVYVLTRSGGTWSQQAYVKASNTDAFDGFGWAVALSASGDALAVGAIGESSGSTGIGGNEGDDSKPGAGAVYRFARSAGAWGQVAYVKASNTDGGDDFGTAVALSADAAVLAVSAEFEASTATGVGGNQANNSALGAGATYVFR